RLGGCKGSLIHVDAADLAKLPEDVLVYGRNGVQERFTNGALRELGIIVENSSPTQKRADLLARLLMPAFNYCGYPGPQGTAGNIALPFSPSLVSFPRPDGLFGAIVVGGTRDPAFIQNYAGIKAAVSELVSHELPGVLSNANFSITTADAENPIILLRTVDR